jgi:hypothetical protein
MSSVMGHVWTYMDPARLQQAGRVGGVHTIGAALARTF